MISDFSHINIIVNVRSFFPEHDVPNYYTTDKHMHMHALMLARTQYPLTPPHTHVDQCPLAHCGSHLAQKVTHLISAGNDCCGDDYMRWCPLHEVVESEEKSTIDKSSFTT